MTTVAILRPQSPKSVHDHLRTGKGVKLYYREEIVGQNTRPIASWSTTTMPVDDGVALGEAVKNLHGAGQVYLVAEGNGAWTHRVYSTTDERGRVGP